MKKMISTLIVSSMITAGVHADHRLSDLHIRNFDNRPVMVSLNNNQFRQTGNNVQFRDLVPGRHQITVWSQSPWGAHGHILYNGFIDVPASSEVRAMITRNRNLRINRIEPIFIPVQPDNWYNPVPVQQPGHCGTISPLGIDPVSFNALMQTITSASFESTRLNIARQAIQQYGTISVSQVREMMQVMSFESSRLEIAKLAYPYTFDRDQYFRLYDVFSFDSSINDLIRFIDRNG